MHVKPLNAVTRLYVWTLRSVRKKYFPCWAEWGYGEKHKEMVKDVLFWQLFYSVYHTRATFNTCCNLWQLAMAGLTAISFLRYTYAQHMLWWLQERTMRETINRCSYKIRVLLCQHRLCLWGAVPALPSAKFRYSTFTGTYSSLSFMLINDF